MIKRILSIAMALALIAVLAAPYAFAASGTTTVTGTAGLYIHFTGAFNCFPRGVLNSSSSNPSTAQSMNAHTDDTGIHHVTITAKDSAGNGSLRNETSRWIEFSFICTFYFCRRLTLITLSGSDQATVSGGDCTSNSDWTTSSMIIAQPPFTAVTQPGYYGTTITFTATFNP